MNKKLEVILNQTKAIAFKYEGRCDDNIMDLIDLDCAFFNDEEENQNNNLFVKVGVYQKETSSQQLINKYVNVPYSYYIIIHNYRMDNSGKDLIFIDKIKVLKPETFFLKYRLLEEAEEPTLFDDIDSNDKELEDENVVVIDDIAEIEKATKIIKKNGRKKKGIKETKA